MLGGPRLIVVWLALGFLLFSLAFAPLQVWRRAREHYRSSTVQGRRGIYRFDSAGLGWEIGRHSGSAPWDAVRKISETDSAFYLLLSPLQPHVIPKAGLSETECAQLSSTLASGARR